MIWLTYFKIGVWTKIEEKDYLTTHWDRQKVPVTDDHGQTRTYVNPE